MKVINDSRKKKEMEFTKLFHLISALTFNLKMGLPYDLRALGPNDT